MKIYAIEFIGTFFLTFIVALTGNPLAIGACLIALVYMGGYISGAHYNPAVTLAVFVRGKLSFAIALRYMLAQIAGATSASLLYLFIKHTYFMPKLGVNITSWEAVIIEALFTFLLAFVVLHVATASKVKGNQYYGLAIGSTLMAIAFAGGPLSGGVYNPAIAIGTYGIALDQLPQHMPTLLLYIGGASVGGFLAGKVYKIIFQNN